MRWLMGREWQKHDCHIAEQYDSHVFDFVYSASMGFKRLLPAFDRIVFNLPFQTL